MCIFLKTGIIRRIYLGDTNMSSDNPLMFALLFSSKGPALQNFVTVMKEVSGRCDFISDGEWFEPRSGPICWSKSNQSMTVYNENFLGQSDTSGTNYVAVFMV